MYPDANQQLKELLMQNSPKQETHSIKVKGRAGAEKVELPPNSDDILIDMDDPIIWFVQSDGAGYVTATPYNISLHKEVTQEDTLKSIEDRLTKIEEELRNGKSDTSETTANSNGYKPRVPEGGNVNARGNDKR